jgi:hypothetical protein
VLSVAPAPVALPLHDRPTLCDQHACTGEDGPAIQERAAGLGACDTGWALDGPAIQERAAGLGVRLTSVQWSGEPHVEV